MVKTDRPKWLKYGFTLSLIAGFYQVLSASLFARIISWVNITPIMGLTVLKGAFLIRTNWPASEILGGILVIFFSFLGVISAMAG